MVPKTSDFMAGFDELRSPAGQRNPRCVGRMLENQEISYIVPTRSWPRQRGWFGGRIKTSRSYSFGAQ